VVFICSSNPVFDNEPTFEIPTGSLIQLHFELEVSKEPVSSFEGSVTKLEIADAELICHKKKCYFYYIIFYLLLGQANNKNHIDFR
jgi:hypothetical protein